MVDSKRPSTGEHHAHRTQPRPRRDPRRRLRRHPRLVPGQARLHRRSGMAVRRHAARLPQQRLCQDRDPRRLHGRAPRHDRLARRQPRRRGVPPLLPERRRRRRHARRASFPRRRSPRRRHRPRGNRPPPRLPQGQQQQRHRARLAAELTAVRTMRVTPLPLTRNRRLTESGRVKSFSDAVFAITITLLVLEIHRPALEEPELGRRLLERWPDYAAFAVSFVYVGVVWLNHHALFARIRNVDLGLNWINLSILATTALLPFPTGVIAGAFSEGASGSREAAVVLYAIVGALMSAAWIPVFPYLARHPDLLL